MRIIVKDLIQSGAHCIKLLPEKTQVSMSFTIDFPSEKTLVKITWVFLQ